jgi:hypothetical protein
MRLVWRIGIIVIIAGAGILFRDRISGKANGLQVGDCFDQPASLAQVKDVQHHPCTEAHDSEVFGLLSYPAAKGDPYPTDDQLRSYVGANCAPVFTSFVGVDPFGQQALDFGMFYPAQDGWSGGDRKITCYLYRTDNARMSVTMKGSGQ